MLHRLALFQREAALFHHALERCIQLTQLVDRSLQIVMPDVPDTVTK